MDFDLTEITATVDGARAVASQVTRGPKRPRDARGPERPWLVEIDAVRFVAAAGATPQRIHLLPEGPPPAGVSASRPRLARVVLAFTVRALRKDLTRSAAAPRGMSIDVGGVRTPVPGDGRVELALELAPASIVTVTFAPGDAALELRLGRD